MDTYSNQINGKGKKNNNNNNIVTTRSIWTGTVISNVDEFDGNRLSVRIQGLDRGIEDDDVSLICCPLFPPFNGLLPKKGEAVMVFLSDTSKPFSLRYWAGPVISQYQNIDEDPIDSALSLTPEARVKPLKPISTIKNANKIFPVEKDDKENLNNIGRDNTIIKHRKNELTLNTGRHLTNKNTELNEKNPTFTRLRLLEDDSESSQVSVADIFAFISHKGEKLTKNNHSLDDQDIETIKKDGYSFLKAEPTIELFQLIIQYLCVQHTHPQNNLKSTKVEATDKLLNFDFNTIISKNHKIN